MSIPGLMFCADLSTTFEMRRALVSSLLASSTQRVYISFTEFEKASQLAQAS